MRGFVKFMVSKAGRILRIVLGLVLIVIGEFLLPKTNYVLIIIGLIPLAAGVFDFCLLAPLFGYYLSGPKTRAKVNSETENPTP